MHSATTFRLTGRHVLFSFLLFFGLVMGANGVFVWVALDTFRGTTSDSAYQEGIDYNDRLTAAAAQKARGWDGNATLNAGQLEVIAQVETAPLTGLQLEAQLRDPTGPAGDQTVPLLETAPGRYTAAVTLPHLGAWGLLVTGQSLDGTPFQLEEHLWVK